MTECCNDFGNCTQGRDCPIRKQRAQETNDAYINQSNRLEQDHMEDIATTFKELIALLAVVAALTMLAFAIWGK